MKRTPRKQQTNTEESKNPIRALRMQLGMTQSALADLLQLTPRTIASLEAPDAETEHPKFQRYLKQFRQLQAERPARADESVAASKRYSFSQETVDLIIARREVLNRAVRVLVEVDFFPLYQEMPADEYDLQLMFALEAVPHIQSKNKNQIIVADVRNVLHFWIVNDEGKLVVDADENQFAKQTVPINALRKQLQNLRPPHELSTQEKTQVIAAVTSITGHTPPISEKPKFAKHYMRVTYENLYAEDPDGLVIDAVGNPDGPSVKDVQRRAKLHLRLVTPAEGSDITGMRKDEFKAYDSLLEAEQPKFIKMRSFEFLNSGSEYANVICYELRKADPIRTPKITVLYFANHAALIEKNAEDAVGFAHPADLLITGGVRVKVAFHEGLRPDAEPGSHPFLIRRYAKSARPKEFLTSDVPRPTETTGKDSDVVTYTFELSRPKPGYGYVISWKGLVWEKTVEPYENYTKVAGESKDGWKNAQPK